MEFALKLATVFRSGHLDVKPAIRTTDCCQLIRYGFLNERIIAKALTVV